MNMLHSIMQLTNISHAPDIDLINNNDLQFHVYAKDTQGKYIGCNQLMAKATGLSTQNDVIGLVDYDLCWETAAQKLQNNDQQVLAEKQTNFFIEPITLIDGNKIICLSRKIPLRAKTKKITGIFGMSLLINMNEWMTAANAETLPNDARFNTQETLTKREKECFLYIKQGYTNKAIANTLALSPRTIENYSERIKEKLGAKSRYDLIVRF